MKTTRASLLLRVRDRGDSDAWEEFVALYRPLLVRYALRRGLAADEAEDVAQYCLLVMARKIDRFEYDPNRGRFRGWLRKMVNDRVASVCRDRRERLAESDDFKRPQEREEQPDRVWQRIWLEEHLKYCMKQVRGHFTPKTLEAFKRFALLGQPIEEVCAALGMTANQVYISKSRVLQRLRELMRPFIGEDPLDL
jgi:RNA polymerase sigma-70 factor (ECF subfamily)